MSEALVTETITVLEQTAQHMNKLARLLRTSKAECLRGEYDALRAFAEQAGKAVGTDVGTKIEALTEALMPKDLP